jgi:hypothetical protein
MSLSEEQTVFVAEVRSNIEGMKSAVNSAIQNLLARKKVIDDSRKDKNFPGTFGDTTEEGTAAAVLVADIVKLDVAIDALIDTGLVTRTRAQFVQSLKSEMPPLMP